MKDRRLRALTLLLALLMLLSAAACGQADDGDGSASTDGSATEEITEADPRKTLDTPDMTFDGYVFRVLTCQEGGLSTYFDVEKIVGEVVDDAIYERNRLIENKYGIRFETDETDYATTMTMLETQVSSGLTGGAAYDLIMQICRNAYSLTLNNMLCDYSRLEYVDINKDYYFGSVNEQFSIGGRTFFAYGAECLNVLEQACCLIYNKKITEDRGFGNFYEMVDNRTWTYDKLFTCCRDAATDLDGDGKMTAGKDLLAMSGRADFTIPESWIPAGEMLIRKDENDMPYYAANGNQRMISVMQESLGFFAEKCCDVYRGDVPLDDFADGKYFMISGCVNEVKKLKDMTTDYGVLPWPLYDETQDRYYARLIDGWLHVVPSNCQDTVRTSVIMQALAYYSDQTVYPAYYEQALTAKYVRDPESVRMLRLILDNLVVDLGDTVWFADLRWPMTSVFASPTGASKVASTLKAYEKLARNDIKSVTKFMEKEN